jgi:heme/copper-type cytochrome/quinol oxidase subunit 2
MTPCGAGIAARFLKILILRAFGTSVALPASVTPAFAQRHGVRLSWRMAMTTLIAMSAVWAVITICFVTMLLYRRSLTKHESDWIPLTDDAKEDKAIEAQTVIEMKTNKLTIPIRTLGTLSVVMLLVIMGFWLYISINTPPPIPQ